MNRNEAEESGLDLFILPTREDAAEFAVKLLEVTGRAVACFEEEVRCGGFYTTIFFVAITPRKRPVVVTKSNQRRIIMRIVNGVTNKMGNSRKKDAKKVVVRAVRRAGKAEVKLTVEQIELGAKYLATSNLCTLDQALKSNSMKREERTVLLPDLKTLKSVVDHAVDIAIEGAMEGMSMESTGGSRNMDRYESKATDMVEKEIKSFRSDLKAGGKRAAYWITTLQKEVPCLFIPEVKNESAA
jgi:hypothetical protein